MRRARRIRYRRVACDGGGEVTLADAASELCTSGAPAICPVFAVLGRPLDGVEGILPEFGEPDEPFAVDQACPTEQTAASVTNAVNAICRNRRRRVEWGRSCYACRLEQSNDELLSDKACQSADALARGLWPGLQPFGHCVRQAHARQLPRSSPARFCTLCYRRRRPSACISARIGALNGDTRPSRNLPTQISQESRTASAGRASPKSARHKSKNSPKKLIADLGPNPSRKLRKLEPETAFRYLRWATRRRAKSALCVMTMSLDADVFAVDANVQRVAGRLGALPDNLKHYEAQKRLPSLVPIDGRGICTWAL